MDWSETNFCIKCSEGGNLLICSENSCPLAMHEGCMGCPARFDDAKHFYCPYCLYRKAVAESRQAHEYAIARKKDLAIFMNEEWTGGEEHCKENKEAEPKMQSKVGAANVNVTTSDDGKRRQKSDDVLDQSIRIDENCRTSDTGKEKIQGEEFRTFGGGTSLKLQEGQNNSNGVEENNQEEQYEFSAGSKSRDPPTKMLEHKICHVEEEKIQEEEYKTTRRSRSCAAHVGPKRSKVASVKSKLVKQGNKGKQMSQSVTPPRRSSRMTSSALRTGKLLKYDVDKQPSVKKSKYVFGSGKGKRNRLLWRKEEEVMLKEGVLKYSEENKCTPWGKILHFGRKVFDETRTPSDLKDKWRNMLEK